MTQQPLPPTPFEHFKKTFIPPYRVLLALGLFSILFSLTSISGVATLLDYLSTDIFYALYGLTSLFIVLPLMIASLILLWHKHPTGIRLRLAGYGASLISAVLGLFTASSTIETLTESVREATLQTSSGAISSELAASLTETSFSATIYLSMLASLLFAYLWWRTWKRQVRIDMLRAKKEGTAS